MGELKNTFRPEFLNRLDEIIVFHPLTHENIKKIVGFMLDTLIKRVAQREIYLDVSDSAKDFIAQKGFDPIYGARPLRRHIQSLVEDKLAEEMLESSIKRGDNVLVDLEDGKIVFKKTTSLIK